jgi:hypothetical protein
MPSDLRYIAVGPSPVGFLTNSSSIAIGAQIKGFKYGASFSCETTGHDILPQAHCGCFGQSTYTTGVIGVGPTGVKGICDETGTDTFPDAGVIGIGPTGVKGLSGHLQIDLGIMWPFPPGNAGILGYGPTGVQGFCDGTSTGPSPSSGVIGVGPTGVKGITNSIKSEDAANIQDAAGVIGIGNTGVEGISFRNAQGVAGQGVSGSGGVGVYGEGFVSGVRGNAGIEIGGDRVAGVGVLAEAVTFIRATGDLCGVGLVAVSQANRAAVFANRRLSDHDLTRLFDESTNINTGRPPIISGYKRVAQINISPTGVTDGDTPPFDGVEGDLLVLQKDPSNITAMWFCTQRSDSIQNKGAIWNKIAFSETFQHPSLPRP